MLRHKFDFTFWDLAEMIVMLPEAIIGFEFLIAAVTGVTTVAAVLGAIL